MQNNDYQQLARLVLPEGLLDYFNIISIDQVDGVLNIYLEEIKAKPIEYKKYKLTSKGFYDEINIQDFPIRGHKVYLHIRRRRWVNEDTGDIVSRDWNLVAKGTRMTQGFASFLKEFVRYTSS